VDRLGRDVSQRVRRNHDQSFKTGAIGPYRPSPWRLRDTEPLRLSNRRSKFVAVAFPNNEINPVAGLTFPATPVASAVRRVVLLR
jgi:hypothetical protein